MIGVVPHAEQDHNTGFTENRGKEIHFATTKAEGVSQIQISQCSPCHTLQENNALEVKQKRMQKMTVCPLGKHHQYVSLALRVRRIYKAIDKLLTGIRLKVMVEEAQPCLT